MAKLGAFERDAGALRTAMSMAWLWRSMVGRPYPLSVVVPLKPEFVAMAILLTVQTPPQRCGIFFVAVGMLIDPQELATHWIALALLSAAVVTGKIVSVSLASTLVGERPDIAVKTGFAMAQIGVFSILIAEVGTRGGAARSFLLVGGGGLRHNRLSVPFADPGVQSGGRLDRPPSPYASPECAFSI